MLHTWVNHDEWSEKECSTPGLIMMNREKSNASKLGYENARK